MLELVKCSPTGGGSKPSEEMWANCPGEYLIEELAALRPRALVVMSLGYPSVRVSMLRESSKWEEVPGLKRGELTIEGRSFPVFCCYHSHAPWRSSVEPLAASVAQRGL